MPDGGDVRHHAVGWAMASVRNPAGTARNGLRRLRRTPLRLLFAAPRPAEIGLSPDGRWISRVDATCDGAVLTVTAADRPAGPGTAGRARRRLDREADGPVRSWSFAGGLSGHAWLPVTDPAAAPALCVTAARSPGGEHRILVLDTAGRCRDVTPDAAQHAVILDRDQVRGRGALIRTGTELHTVHLVRADGRVTPVGPAAMVDRWIVDPREHLRAAVRWDTDGTLVVLRRQDGDRAAPWRTVLRLPAPESLLTYPVDTTGDGRGLLLHGPFGGDHLHVVRLDLDTGALTPVVRVPGRDIGSLWLHPTRRTVQFLELSGPRPGYLAVDDEVRADLEWLPVYEPGNFRIVARSATDRQWLLACGSDVAPERYVLWDRDRRRSTGLAPVRTGRRQAPMLPFEIQASDGTPIGGYLTAPLTGGLPAPTVLLVHGGPWGSDEWRHSPDVQWLSDAGHACLQVNFRGSEGRGRSFMDAADGDWGGRMQQDLLDAVSWAVASGYTDASQVYIMGTSYGGYAALMAATVGAPVFRAAVAVCAPSDLVAWTAQMTGSRHYLSAVVRCRLGDPSADRDRLHRQSPLTHAARAHTPLLLVHGERDTVVPPEHSVRMAAALREHRRPHRVLSLADEGHGVQTSAGRVRLARTVERFFAAARRTGGIGTG
jgi:dipeptidyl aminopeptidase/acylaminoacyl peptidase